MFSIFWWIIGLLILGYFLYMIVFFAPWVPTRARDYTRVREIAKLKKGDIFYDLGSGDGRVIFALAKTEANVIGVEFFYPLFLISKIRQLWNYKGNKNIIFKCSDLFREDLTKADVVFLFGVPDTLKSKLKEKLESELKKGSKVLSYAFSIEGWEVTREDRGDDGKKLPIWVYER